MTHKASLPDDASTRELLDSKPTPQPSISQPPSNDAKPSLWQTLKADNEARKEKEVQYVSTEEAERISGNGEQRVKKEEEEERKRTGEKGGSKSLVGALFLS